MQRQQSRVESDKEEIAVWTTIWNSWENNENIECPDLRVRDVTRSLSVTTLFFFVKKREEELHAKIMRSRKIDWTMMIADGWWSTICTIIFLRLDSSLHLDSLTVHAIIPTRNRISSHLWKSSFNANAIYAEHYWLAQRRLVDLTGQFSATQRCWTFERGFRELTHDDNDDDVEKSTLFLFCARCDHIRRGVEADIVAVLVSIT